MVAPSNAERFALGYADGGGPPQYLDHFLAVVLPCEASAWTGAQVDGSNGYFTRAQFSGDTWAKVVAELWRRNLPPDGTDPYIVGVAVGWWASITVPSGQWGTWYGCRFPTPL